MKTVRVKSNKYHNTAVNFGGFIMKFNKAGIAELDLRDNAEEVKLDETLAQYSDFVCYLDAVTDKEMQAKKNQDVEYLNKTIDSLREELKVAKTVNESLATENTQLKAELKVYREQAFNKSSIVENKVTEDKIEDKKEENTQAPSSEDLIRKELNKKTVAQLMDIVEDLFGDDKEEWKSLNKKDDLVNYIIKKQTV